MSQVSIVAALASLYAFRMLGLFMVLPVLMLYGSEYQNATPFLLGLALGIYGLTQACLQIPLGLLSDFLGRKPVIFGGLLLFAVGSLVAAFAESVEGLIIGRALQGAGAIASAIMAMVADLTSEQNRTKAMAAIGASIGVAFCLAMMIGPVIAAYWHMSGVFFVASFLSLVGLLIVVFILPTPTVSSVHPDATAAPALIKGTLRNKQLLRLNFGIFVLHCVLMAIFIALPAMIEQQLGLAKAQHWQFYIPVLLGAFVLMLPLMLTAEKRGQVKVVFLAAVFVLGVSVLGLVTDAHPPRALIALMMFFFLAFNLLESLLPSLVSKVATPDAKGTAMGLYSTSQFLGAFCGGAMGGWLMQSHGAEAIFLFAAVLVFLWFLAAFAMKIPDPQVRFDLVAGCVIEKDAIARLPGVTEVVNWDETQITIKVDRRVFDEARMQALLKPVNAPDAVLAETAQRHSQ